MLPHFANVNSAAFQQLSVFKLDSFVLLDSTSQAYHTEILSTTLITPPTKGQSIYEKLQINSPLFRINHRGWPC